ARRPVLLRRHPDALGTARDSRTRSPGALRGRRVGHRSGRIEAISLVPAVTPMAAAEIRHLHHWTGHLHHRADHAHDVAAAAEAAGDSHAAEAATAARDHA